MKKILFIILIFSLNNSFSQNALLFVNQLTKDSLIIYERDKVNLAYFGYLNQEESVKGKIININDSIITVANVFLGNYINKRKIKISDVLGVRKYSKIRQVAKFTLNASVIVVSILLPEAIGITSSAGIYATAVGTGAAGMLITQMIFPDKIKISKRKGWEIKILYPRL